MIIFVPCAVKSSRIPFFCHAVTVSVKSVSTVLENQENSGVSRLQKKILKPHPPPNLALRNLCESFLKERNERRSSGSEEICSLHSEKLKLFLSGGQQPVCLVCMNSQKHDNHKFRPIDEVVSSYKVREPAFSQLHVVLQ